MKLPTSEGVEDGGFVGLLRGGASGGGFGELGEEMEGRVAGVKEGDAGAVEVVDERLLRGSDVALLSEDVAEGLDGLGDDGEEVDQGFERFRRVLQEEGTNGIEGGSEERVGLKREDMPATALIDHQAKLVELVEEDGWGHGGELRGWGRGL